MKKVIFNAPSTTNQTSVCWGFYFKKDFDVLIVPAATGNLLYITPSYAKYKNLYLLKR